MSCQVSCHCREQRDQPTLQHHKRDRAGYVSNDQGQGQEPPGQTAQVPAAPAGTCTETNPKTSPPCQTSWQGLRSEMTTRQSRCRTARWTAMTFPLIPVDLQSGSSKTMLQSRTVRPISISITFKRCPDACILPAMTVRQRAATPCMDLLQENRPLSSYDGGRMPSCAGSTEISPWQTPGRPAFRKTLPIC